MAMVFRQYNTQEDCYLQAWDLRQRILRTPVGLTLTATDRDNDLSSWHFGLFDNDRLIATVTVEKMPSDQTMPEQVKLRQMVVDPHYQGRGLGQQLLIKTEQVLRDKSVSVITLAARLPAVGFYQKLGFKVQSPIYHHLGIDHRDMIKYLS